MEPGVMKKFLLKQFNLLMEQVDGPITDASVDRAINQLLAVVAREIGEFIGVQEDEPQATLGEFMLDLASGVFHSMSELQDQNEKSDGTVQ